MRPSCKWDLRRTPEGSQSGLENPCRRLFCCRKFAQADLRFVDCQVENEYASEINSSCLQVHFRVAILPAVVAGFSALQHQWTSNAMSSKWAAQRFIFWELIGVVIFSALVMALCKSKLLRAYGERFFVLTACLFAVSIVLADNYRTARMHNEEPELVWQKRSHDSSTLLVLDGWVTFCFLMYPCRVRLSWMIPAVSWLTFVGATVRCGGGPEGVGNDVFNSFVLGIISIGVWVGRYWNEEIHRDLWLRFRKEQMEVKRSVSILRAFADATVVLAGQPAINVAVGCSEFDEIFAMPMTGTDLRVQVLRSDIRRFDAFIAQVSNGPEGNPHKLSISFTDANKMKFEANLSAARCGGQIVLAVQHSGEKSQAPNADSQGPLPPPEVYTTGNSLEQISVIHDSLEQISVIHEDRELQEAYRAGVSSSSSAMESSRSEGNEQRSRRSRSRSRSRRERSREPVEKPSAPLSIVSEVEFVETGWATICYGLLNVVRTWHLAEPGTWKATAIAAIQMLEDSAAEVHPPTDTSGRQCQNCYSCLRDDLDRWCIICWAPTNPHLLDDTSTVMSEASIPALIGRSTVSEL